ncbi:MAG: hypothetical protein ACW98X_26680, partial [Promethearchaeota archaeon]
MQTAISETKRGIFDKVISQQFGKNFRKRNGSIEKKDNKVQRRKNDNGIRWDNLYSLNKLNPLVVLAKRDVSQGQFLTSFYKALQHHPDFSPADIKITPEMSKKEVIKLFHKKVLDFKGDKYQLEYQFDSEDYGFQIMLYRDISMDYYNNSIQLYWLDNLEKKNKRLYNIITRGLSIIHYSLGIELWDEGYEENWLDYFAGELDDRGYDYEEVKEAMDEWQEYLSKDDVKRVKSDYGGHNTSKLKVRNGKSIKHLKRLRKRFNYNKLNVDLESFKCKTRLERELIKWIKEGLELTKLKCHIGDFRLHTIEELEEGIPLSVTESYKFSWSFHTDYWQHHIEPYMNDTYANFGCIGARAYIILTPEQAHISDSEEKENQIMKIHTWFGKGVNLYWDTIGKYLELPH